MNECVFTREDYAFIVKNMITVMDIARAWGRDGGWVAKQLKLAKELYDEPPSHSHDRVLRTS